MCYQSLERSNNRGGYNSRLTNAKRMKKYLLLAAATIALAACHNDDNYIDEPVAAQITATIGQSSLSRASETSWGTDDAIGVTMDDKYVNLKYTTKNGDGNFTGTTMYFKNKREPVTLTAYYPFVGPEGTAPGIIKVNTGADDNQASDKQPYIDFLYAVKENVTGENPEVKFDFSHKMSKLTLKFKNGTGAEGIRITSYTVSGLVMDGTFDTVSGVCAANEDGAAEDLSISLSGDTDGVLLPSLILFPQSTDGKTVRLKISDNEGQDYACNLSFENNRIESGNNYQFTITVNKTGLIVNTPTITDWETKSNATDAESDWKNNNTDSGQ